MQIRRCFLGCGVLQLHLVVGALLSQALSGCALLRWHVGRAHGCSGEDDRDLAIHGAQFGVSFGYRVRSPLTHLNKLGALLGEPDLLATAPLAGWCERHLSRRQGLNHA
jgi:hypothetical protein